MTFEEMFAQAKTALEKADASAVSEHIAVQFTISGDGSGIFYAKISDGVLTAEPYDYVDNDAVLFADGKALLEALTNAKAEALDLAGNEEKIAQFRQVLATLPAPKKATPKATAKPAAAKAAPVKATEAKKTEAKPAAKTPAAKKPAARSGKRK